MADTDLRSYAFLDPRQPQYPAFLGTVAQGILPLEAAGATRIGASAGVAIVGGGEGDGRY